MRIIYGVSGEGSGHSSRAKQMARHLIAAGHELVVVSYNRGYDALHSSFPCHEIEGLRIVSIDNRVSILRTLIGNLLKLPAFYRSLKSLRQVFDDFKPELVISDFEPMTARLAGRRRLPLISLDNQHRMRFMEYTSPSHLRVDRWVTELVIRLLVPNPDVCLATTFLIGPVKNDRTFLFPPILREEVGNITPSEGEHLLVYVTNQYDTLIASLHALSDERFIVYGYHKDEQSGNVQFKQFSTLGFLEDVASARAIIATAGFTLMSEAMYLQKPYLAFPMRGQFEQQLNAFCLEELGFGESAQNADPETLRKFLNHLPRYRDALSRYDNAYSNKPLALENTEICAKLDELLADNAQLLRQYQQRRIANTSV